MEKVSKSPLITKVIKQQNQREREVFNIKLSIDLYICVWTVKPLCESDLIHATCYCTVELS